MSLLVGEEGGPGGAADLGADHHARGGGGGAEVA
jgi:hypothetical protein